MEADFVASDPLSGMSKIIQSIASEFYLSDVGGRCAGSMFVVKEQFFWTDNR